MSEPQTDADNLPDVQERVLAGRVLSLGAGKASEALDVFSGWLLAGFGGAFALMFGNLDDVAKFVSPHDIKRALLAFLFALFLGIVQKLLAAIVSSGTAAASAGEAIGHDLAEKGIELDFRKVFAELERATIFPLQKMVTRKLKAVLKGDFAAGGRTHARLSQVQAICVLVEVMFCIAAGTILALGLSA